MTKKRQKIIAFMKLSVILILLQIVSPVVVEAVSGVPISPVWVVYGYILGLVLAVANDVFKEACDRIDAMYEEHQNQN